MHTHLDKQEHIFQHFSNFGYRPSRTHTLDWDVVGLHRVQLHNLEDMFTEEEVHDVISELASDKALDRMDLLVCFFKSAWGSLNQM